MCFESDFAVVGSGVCDGDDGDVDVFDAGFLHGAGAFDDGCAAGEDVVDKQDAFWQAGAGTKRAGDVVRPPGATDLSTLDLGRADASQAGHHGHGRATDELAGDELGRVEPPAEHAPRVQRDGDDGAGEGDGFGDGGLVGKLLAKPLADGPLSRELASKHEPPNRPLVCGPAEDGPNVGETTVAAALAATAVHARQRAAFGARRGHRAAAGFTLTTRAEGVPAPGFAAVDALGGKQQFARNGCGQAPAAGQRRDEWRGSHGVT